MGAYIVLYPRARVLTFLLRDVAERHLGAFGFPAPYGHKPVGAQWIGFNMDIVGGVEALG